MTEASNAPRPAWKLPLLNSYIDKWAHETPQAVAMLQHEDGREVTYRQFASLIDYFALRLLNAGIERGDRVATQLPTIPEHFALMYACFKIGALAAPLDLRLKPREVVRDLAKIAPQAFFFLGKTPVRDFRDAGQAVKEQCPSVRLLVQLTANPAPEELLAGAQAITEFMSKGRLVRLKLCDLFTRALAARARGNRPDSPALIIYTTGTTGEPKPAVLTHETIITQNEVLARGIAQVRDQLSLLINLPASHVGGTTEAPMTAFYCGGTAVLLRVFDPRLSLEAIAKRRVTVIGQIPTQFRLEWALPDYASYDLSSLRLAIYGGSSVDAAFLRKLGAMAPACGTGLGMTEAGGFITFTEAGIGAEEMAGQVGGSYEDLAEVSVRRDLRPDGSAGEELADGEVGEICCHPPLVFAGYYNAKEATARVISKEGILYSGDIGYFKSVKGKRVLCLCGRRKFIIRQKGYQVYPDEVQAHIATHEKVALAEVVGVPHAIYDEGIFAFVKPQKGAALTAAEIAAHCRAIAAYKRPQHVEILSEDAELPRTRVAKVDKMALQERAHVIVEQLRANGGWDKAAHEPENEVA